MIGPPYGPVLNGTMVIVFWEYRPSDTAALAFVALFGLLTIAHIILMFMFRAWCFIPFVLGGISKSLSTTSLHSNTKPIHTENKEKDNITNFIDMKN